MKRNGLLALALFGALALQGCAAPAASDAGADESGAGIEAPDSAGQTGADQAAPDAPAPDAPAEPAFPDEFFTVAYADSYKSIFLLDRAQVEAVAGVALTDDTREQARAALSQAALWESDERSAEHAALISDAFSRESDRAAQALAAVQADSHARVKVYVGHNSHKSIAHIELGD